MTETKTPVRMKLFLKAVEDLWKENPDWRFGQLSANICNAGRRCENKEAISDHFNTEDKTARSGLEFLLEVEFKNKGNK
jgi:hypothetical protein